MKISASRESVAGALALLVLLTAVIPASAQCPFRPDGYFVLHGAAPRGFESFAYLALWDYERERGPECPSGVFTSTREYYAIPALNIYPDPRGNIWRWDFTTAEVSQVSYRFRGEFTSYCDFARPEVAPVGRVMLRGRLSRCVNGNVLSWADVSFEYSLARPRKAYACADL
jgi:hypothetical protein